MARESIPVVQTVGLTKIFRDFWRRPRVNAVKDLDMEIRPGEVFGLLGPNGSGKSTTIKMLLGLLYPTRGRIAVFGRPPTDVQIKNRIGFLPEETYLYRFLNARETLDYFGRLFRQNGSMRTDRIERLLDMVGLQHESRRRIGEYSKGMARRIGLAQALINDPDFLILDEPTSGLDPIGTRQIKDLIRELARKGKTILLSSHLLADVEDVCDRVTILYGGQQRAAGDIRDLLSKKELTQITSERLSDNTVNQVRSLIDRLEHKQVFEVSAPSERLENLFIRIVNEAQQANIATSGARAPGAIPEFLRAQSEGEEVIESLVSATRAKPVEVAPEKPAEPRKPEPVRQIVEELSKAADHRTRAVDPEAASRPEPKVEPDKNVLDSLLGDKKEGGHG